MNIGYRRYSGKAYLDPVDVTSKRGAWLEKRMALFEFLRKRNTVTIIKTGDSYNHYDKILVEFGSTNYAFHKEDIDFSEEVLASGKAIFILDDPDMMPKSLLTKHVEVPIFVNASAKRCSAFWERSNIEEFPIYGLQHLMASKAKYEPQYVFYGGTSGGREKRLARYVQLVPNLKIYGAKKDYKMMVPLEPPSQAERANFYAGFMGSLCVTDMRHRKLGWNTGRRWHSILAGCPVVEEGTDMFEKLKQLEDPEYRQKKIQLQQSAVYNAHVECDNLLEKYGM